MSERFWQVPWNFNKTGFHLLLAVFVLTGAANAQGADEGQSCSQLFSGSRPSLTQPQASLLSAASEEYIRRLHFLLLERGLIDAKDLQKLIESPRPLNPLAGRMISVTLLPHADAFRRLLQDDLQWDLIQREARNLLQIEEVKEGRRESAVEETGLVVMPIEIKAFPFIAQRIVTTSNGQILGVADIHDQKNRKTTIAAFDLNTGVKLRSVTVPGLTSFNGLDVIAWDGTVLVTFRGLGNNKIVTIDLLKEKILSQPETDPEVKVSPTTQRKDSPEVKDPRFIVSSGRLGVATFQGFNALFLNPFTGEFAPKVVVNAENLFGPNVSGASGESLFGASWLKQTYFVDQTGPGSIREVPGIMTLSTFSYHERTYAFGIDLNAGSKDPARPRVKTLGLDNGVESAPMDIEWQSFNPVLLDKFEQDGVLYGIISSDKEAYVVELLSGKIILKQSDINPVTSSDIMSFKWTEQFKGQIGFNYNGRHYIIAMRLVRDSQALPKLMILDALTLEPINQLSYELPSRPSRALMLPPDGGSQRILLGFNDGTSRLLSLSGRLQSTGH